MIHRILDNGLEVVIRPNFSSPTVAIQVWVRVGSLDEGPHERGMAHFLEHMLFKGTARRKVGEIAAQVEGYGGDINAYTTFDHTVYHLTLASAHTAMGLDIMADAFGSSTLDPEEFDRERSVILEEIKRSLDNPGSIVGRKVFELAFDGSEAARPIIGSVESVSSFTVEGLRDFYRRWYQPANATLVIVGHVDPEEILARVEESFGTLPKSLDSAHLEGRVPHDMGTALHHVQSSRASRPKVSIIRGDYKQVRLEVTFPAPSLAHFDSAALDMAAFALGSGDMGRLTRRLRDRDGVVNSIGASVYSPLFGGLLEISAFVTEEQICDGIRGIAREVMAMLRQEPVTEAELERGRANLRAERVFRDETVDGQARSLGYGMLTPYKLLYDEVYSAVILAMPETAVTGALQRWIKPQAASIVVLVPQGSPLTDEELLAAFDEGVLQGTIAPSSPPVARRSPRSSEATPVPQVFELKPGLKVIYRPNPLGQIFSLTAATEGGLRFEDGCSAGLFNAMSGLLGMASRGCDYASVLLATEGRGASMGGFSGKDSVGFHLQCLPEHAPSILELWSQTLLSPVFPEEQWEALKREILQAIRAQGDSAASVAMRRFQELIFGDHPYRYSLVGTIESVRPMTHEFLRTKFESHRDQGPWVIAATGPQSADEVLEYLGKTLTGFNPTQALRLPPLGEDPENRRTTRGSRSHRTVKDREQLHLVYGFPGLAWVDSDRPALDVLVHVLGGHGGRLFSQLRDREGLAYAVSPLVSYGQSAGAVGSYLACAPDKRERAILGLQREMLALREILPSTEELVRAKNHLIGTHDMGLQRSDALTSTMALMDLYGCGYDEYERYSQKVRRVSVEDVRRVARRLLDPELAVDVTVGPE